MQSLTATVTAAWAMLGGLFPALGHADEYDIPNVPLIVAIEAVPNIWFHLDDSGSMDWEILAGPHFSICRYDSILRCGTIGNPTQGRIRDWTGYRNASDGRAFIATFEYIFDFDDYHAYGSDCPEDSDDDNNNESFEECRDEIGDSISVGGESIPYRQDWRARSSDLNVQFYNPNLTYEPWPDTDSYNFPVAQFTSARSWPTPDELGYENQVNLNTIESGGGAFYYHYWIDDKGWDTNDDYPVADPPNVTSGGNGVIDAWDSYVRVTVSGSNSSGSFTCELVSHSPVGFTWPTSIDGLKPTVTPLSSGDSRCVAATGGLNGNQLTRNVANWFSYGRRRTHVARGAVANVVENLPDFRYGSGFINTTTFYHPIPAGEITDYPANTSDMLDVIYTRNRTTSGTPLRQGLEWVGDMLADDNASVASPINLYCQKNFTLLFTDGFWNGADPGTPSGDVDGDGASVDGETVTLADVAKHYYETDLRADLQDGVPTDGFDTANWQHMVTYGVAFGVEGALTDTDGDGWPNPPLGDADNWYPGTNDQDKIDDLWHAAWNSRGRYFSAKEPQELYEDVERALSDIASRIGGAASAAANSGAISSTSRIFQAKFDTSDWHGELLSIPVNDDGTLGSTPVWNTNTLISAESDTALRFNAGSGRDVFTWNDAGNPATGVPFEWGSLNMEQQNALNKNQDGVPDPDTFQLGEFRAQYVRGVAAREQRNGGQFRDRTNKLGDIVNSDPIFVGFPPFFYSFGNYQTFFQNNASRAGMIYFGANDGMFHAVDELSGEILFSYVPDKVIPNLPKLMDPGYSHAFYVDGPPEYGDIQDGLGNWKSIIASGLRAGGQGLFALDVTNPTSFSASDVLWEFTDEDDPDLGYTYGQPQIKRMQNGKWAVIIGNGINNTELDGPVACDEAGSTCSTTGAGAVYILFIEDGRDGWNSSDFVKITVPGGSASDPNAIFTPAAADIDGDAKVDYIYAGDRNGKMWKIDVTDASPSNWGLAFGGQPLFTAQNGQPITDRPAVAAHPQGIGLGQLVIFGTGQFIENDDNTDQNQPTQSIYAIWDLSKDLASQGYPANGYALGSLSQATFGVTQGQRVINAGTEVDWLDDQNEPNERGWYMNLPVAGERIRRRPVLRDNLVFFVTLIPDDDPCSAGGTGWIMVLDASTGLAPTFPVFDIDDDRDVTFEDDLIDDDGDPDTPGITPVGISSPSIPNLPAIIYDDRPGFAAGNSPFPPQPNASRGCDAGSARAYTFTTGSNGAILAVETATETLSCGRQSWRGER